MGQVGVGGLPGTGGLLFTLQRSESGVCDASVLGGVLSLGCNAVTGDHSFLALDSLSADASLFVGSGSFPVPISASIGSFTGAGVAAFPLPPFSVDASINGGVGMYGRLDLTYDYTPVPEPSTWLLLTTGLGLIGLGRRRLLRVG